MGTMKDIVTMLGFGAACAKSSYDLNKQAKSPAVQRGMAEYNYMYGQVPRMKGYNRVLEFDVSHAKIREIFPEYIKYTVQCKFVEESVQRNQAAFESFIREKEPHPTLANSIIKYQNNDTLLKLGWWKWVQKNDPELIKKMQEWDAKPLEDKMPDIRKHVWLAQTCWLMNNQPRFYEQRYNFREYIMEVARKTAYDNGYLPSCQNINRSRLLGYATLYHGQIRCGWSEYVDWVRGIPNQVARERLAGYDREGTF